MYDPHTRESRGFGFVTMETGEEADAAIAALHGTELMGKIMTVDKVCASFFFLFSADDVIRLAVAAQGLQPLAAIMDHPRGTTVWCFCFICLTH